MSANLENSAVFHRTGHRTDIFESVFIPIPKKGSDKECSKHFTITLILYASKVMLKILQQYVNQEFPDVQTGFKKRQRNQRSNYQQPLDHRKSKTVPEKHLLLFY